MADIDLPLDIFSGFKDVAIPLAIILGLIIIIKWIQWIMERAKQ